MKKIYIIFVAVIITISNIYAQENNQELNTVFKDGIKKVSGFGGPMMLFSSTNSEFAHFMGGGGAILLNNSLFFGGFGYGMTTTQKAQNYVLNPDLDLRFGFGGLWGGYIINWAKAFHPVISLQAGWGAITLSDKNNNRISSNAISVIIPLVELEMNITKFFRVSFGGTYRFVSGVKYSGYTNNDFSSAGLYLGFKFGWF